MNQLTQQSDNYSLMYLIDSQPMDDLYTSIHYDISTMDMGSIQFPYSGADTKKAQFIVEVSNNGLCWCSPFPESLTKTSTVGSGCVMYEMPSLTSRYIRARIDPKTNTAGTFSAVLFVKRRRSNNP